MFCYNLYCFVYYYYYYVVSTYVDEDIEQHTIYEPSSTYVDSDITILIVCFVGRIDEVDEDRDQHGRITPRRLTSTRVI